MAGEAGESSEWPVVAFGREQARRAVIEGSQVVIDRRVKSRDFADNSGGAVLRRMRETASTGPWTAT